MHRETATVLLPSRRRIDVAGLARTCTPPWHAWRGGSIARAECSADGRVRLVVVRPRPRGLLLAVTGVGAGHAEILAPIAARVRRAFQLDGGSGLLGTCGFEDAVLGLFHDLATPPPVRRRILALGRRCPVAAALRTMPQPQALLAVPVRVLARLTGSSVLALRLQALARAFTAIAPSAPSVS